MTLIASPVQLQSITLENFKSFKGKVLIGPFGKLTSLLGRNGSGKSNFLDALAFLLGANYNALRVRSTDELHNSGNSLACSQAGSQCVTSVSATFIKNDGSQIKFTRKLVDSVSSSLIDDQPVTCQLMLERLTECGLDFMSKCLVFQNTVESLPFMRKQEFVSFFENVSGVSALNVEEAMWLKEMNSKRKNELNLKERLRELRAKLLQGNVTDMDRNRETYLVTLHEKRKKYYLFQLFHARQDYLETHTNFPRENSDVISAKDNCREQQQAYTNAKADLEQTEEDLRKADNEVALQKLVVADVKRNMQESNSKLSKAKGTCQQSNTTVEALDAEIEGYKDKIASLQHQIAGKMDEIARVKEGGLDLSDEQMAKLRQVELESLSQIPELEEVKTQGLILKAFEKQVETCQEQVQRYEEGLKAANSNIVSMEEALTQTTIKLTEELHKQECMKEQIVSLESTLSLAREKKVDVEAKLEKVNIQLVHCQENKFEKDKNERVDRLQQKFGKEAVLGRLVNLVSARKVDHHLALWRAAGQYKDAIVVDTPETAKRCLNFIKENLWNRVLCLPIESLPVPNHNWCQQLNLWTKKPYWPLHSLMEYDPKIESVIAQAFGKTVLCEDSDDAAKIAMQIRANGEAINVVSVIGTLFKSSGLIKGGRGNPPSVGGMQLKEWKQEKAKLIEELRNVREDLQKQPKLEQIKGKLGTIEVFIRVLSNSQNERKLAIQTESENRENLLAKLKGSRQNLQKEETKLTKFKIEMDDIRKVVDEKRKEFLASQTDFAPGVNIFEYQAECVKYRKMEGDCKLHEASKNSLQNRLKHLEGRRIQEINSSIFWEKARDAVDAELKQLGDKFKEATDFLAVKEANLKNFQEKHPISNVAMREAKDLLKLRKTEVKKAERKLNSLALAGIRAQGRWSAILKSVILESKEKDVDLEVEGFDETMSSAESSQFDPRNLEFDFSSLPVELKLLRTEEQRREQILAAEDGISTLEAQIRDCTVSPLWRAQLRQVREEVDLCAADCSVARVAFRKAMRNHSLVRNKRLESIRRVLKAVLEHLNPIYRKLYGTEEAWLDLVFSPDGDIREEGIAIVCNPPQKRVTSINVLSGGEKTLVSLAILFALQKFKPSSVMVLDEVDSALDQKSVENLMAFLEAESEEKQILMISHQPQALVRSDIILGIHAKMLDTDGHIGVLSLDMQRCMGRN